MVNILALNVALNIFKWRESVAQFSQSYDKRKKNVSKEARKVVSVNNKTEAI